MQRPVWFTIIGLVLGIGVGVGLMWLLQPRAPKDASAELAVAKDHLNAGETQDAYDALLAAMRVAPSDGKVFDASLDLFSAPWSVLQRRAGWTATSPL
jgi:hypothetical protein